MDVYEKSVRLHAAKKGKLATVSKVKLATREDLSLAYTPGVAEPCRRIQANSAEAFRLTLRANTIAVLSDGSAVLGLGNIGAEAAIPVMEGKAVLFKEFGGLDAFPICVRSQEPRDIIRTARDISPVFAGINLEDIAAPKCFEVEASLQDLGIPVMHDDQHGTAIVAGAALKNALKVVGKKPSTVKIVINGAGAAGIAVARMILKALTPKEMIVCDSQGAIYSGRPGLNPYKTELASMTNRRRLHGSLADALRGADVFIGVSVGKIVNTDMIRSMNSKAIVFALANPTPEISPEEALAGGARVVATGRSDYPNQVNNVLAFPAVFRGAVDAAATRITEGMKLAALEALAGCVGKPTSTYILPSPLQRDYVKAVAQAVSKQALKEGAVRKPKA